MGGPVWSLNSPEFFGLLASRGLSPEEYAAMVGDLLLRAVRA